MPSSGGFSNIETDYTEDTPHVSGDVGTFILTVRSDAGGPLAADGDYHPLLVDSTGRLIVTTAGGGGGITFDYAEDSPHVNGDNGAFVLAVRNDTAAVTTSANGDYSQFSVDSSGRLGITDLGGSITVDGTVTVIQGTSPWVVSGTVTVDTNYDFAEDSPHVSGDIGAFVLAVRNDTAATRTSADGDYSPISTDAAGRVGISDLGGSITVDGTVTVLQGTSPWIVSGTVTADTNFDYPEDSVHVSGDVGAFTLGVRNDTAAVLTSADGDYSPFAIDSAGRIGISDLGGSISIDDNGGSITVDGTVTVLQGTSPWVVSGTVTADTNFDYPEDSPHVSGDIGAFVLAVRNDAGTALAADGDYIPFTTDSTGALRISGGGGQQFAEDSPHTSGDIGTQVLAVRNDVPGTLVSADGDYASFQQDGAGGIRVAGTIRQDDPIVVATHSPIIVGGRAATAVPTDVSAGGDLVIAWMDPSGRLRTYNSKRIRLGLYYAAGAQTTIAAAADGATAGDFWLVNTSATTAVSLRNCKFVVTLGTALLSTTRPQISMERMTFTGTPTGAIIPAALRDSLDAAPVGTFRTANTGMVITTGNTVKSFQSHTALLASATSHVIEQVFQPFDEDGFIVLRQNQGLVWRQSTAGTVADSRQYQIDIVWEEWLV